MSKKTQQHPTCDINVTQLMNDLRSDNPMIRARAVHSVCPCRLGFGVFEELMPIVSALQKDPNPEVRGAALHVFQDGYEMMSDGMPTTRRMVKNDMVAKRVRSRFRAA